MLAPGTVVHGRYEVVRQIGRGGMGAVYEATDLRLRCRVALKEMRVQGQEAAAAFEHEAQLLASLRHAALPVVIDHFVGVDGQFLVMQFIAGEDLETGLRKRGAAFALGDVLPWLDALLGALEYLHSHQPPVIHRDIKPANLKLTPDGEIVLLDFGLAKGAVGAEAATAAPSVVGYTPRYSPLEQVDGTGTDPRSDVYALGATVYHLLTGIAPANALARAAALMNREPDPLADAHAACADVPPAVAAVLGKALALARGERYASVAAMRADFHAAVARPDAAAAVARPETRPRRVDAAVPSHAQVGARIDLIVQVRFPDSPRLGLEDWPSRRRPEAIEQTSEQVRLVFPVDPATERAGSARLLVKVVAPDFLIEGRPHQAIDVPPEAYSQRLSFLLTAVRPGLCRINVEIYAADSVFLGSVPVETDVCDAPAEVGQYCVSNLVLSVIARQVAAIMARPTDGSPSEAPTVAPEPVEAGHVLGVGLPPAAGRPVSGDTGNWGALIPTHPPQPAAAPPRREAPAAASSPRAAGPRRSSRILATAAAVALMVTAGTVYVVQRERRAPGVELPPQATVIQEAPTLPAGGEPPMPAAPAAARPPTASQPPAETQAPARPAPASPAPAQPRVVEVPLSRLGGAPGQTSSSALAGPLVSVSATSLTHPSLRLEARTQRHRRDEQDMLVVLIFQNIGQEAVPAPVEVEIGVTWEGSDRLYGVTLRGGTATKGTGWRPGDRCFFGLELLRAPTHIDKITLRVVAIRGSGTPVRFAPLVVTIR